MAAENARESRDLQRSIRQLLSGVTAAVSGSQSKVLSLEDAIANLETNDENFHSYDLVRYVQSHIETAIGPLIDKGLEKFDQSSGYEHNLVAQITDDILTSSDYNDFCQSILAEVKDVVDTLLHSDTIQNDMSDSNITFGGHISLSGTTTSSPMTHYFPLEDSVTSELSSIKDTGLLFIPQDQLINITQQLSSSQPLQTRLQAIQQLQHFPPGDLPQCENWSSVRSALLESLMANDTTLSDSVLKLLSRMYGVISATTAKEVYSILVAQLTLYFQDTHDTNLDLDPTTDYNIMLLHRFRLVNHIQLDLPSYWIRYNDRVVEEVMDLTFSLLELSYNNELHVHPLHYFCILDPQALWFQKWMHTQYGRNKVVECLKDKPIVLTGLLNHIINYSFKSENKPQNHDNASTYSLTDLHYLHFLHAIKITERLLLHKHGQLLLATALKSQPTICSLEMFIEHLMRLLLQLLSTQIIQPCDSHVIYSPVVALNHLFSELAAAGNKCHLLCQDNVMELILSSLNSKSNEQCNNEGFISIINNTLAVLASSMIGRQYLLKPSNIKRLSTADVIAQFVATSLEEHVDTWPSEVVFASLFVCRQLYNTAEGLLALLPYGLHHQIAKTVHTLSAAESASSKNFMTKKTQLIDNLLNFAGTPKGVELLEESGLMDECIKYMRHRYELKLQVSQCEKFGYGFMVTQVASNKTGMVHLINSGYVSDLVNDLWSLLNGEEDNNIIKTHPLDPADRVMYKAIINILNVISSFSALHTALTLQPSHQTTPTELTSIHGLLDALIINSSNETIVLMNNDEVHLCGLRILSVLLTSLDSFIVLEKLYNLIDTLLSLQKNCQLNNKHYIVDACSIERNRLLLATSCLGGPTERQLPSHTLLQISDTYQWPFHEGRQLSPCYQPSVSYKHTQQTINITGATTLSELRSIYIHNLQQHHHLSTEDIRVLLKKSINLSECCFPEVVVDINATFDVLPRQQEIIHSLVKQYSLHIGLQMPKDTHALYGILAKFKHLPVCGCQDVCSDWFVITTSLIMFQSHDQSGDGVCKFLKQFSCLLVSLYVWILRPYMEPSLIKLHQSVTTSLHYIELLLQAELPLVYSAFRLSGYTPSQVCQDWIRQCFWNYLDWPEICLYIVNCILLGVDYQGLVSQCGNVLTNILLLHCHCTTNVYFCVAIFKHLQSDILKACQEHNLLIFLKEEPLTGFSTSSYLSYMLELQEKYRSCVLKNMEDLVHKH